MPDLVRLRYIGAAPVTVPVLGQTVEPDCIVDFPGRIVTEPPEGAKWLDDAIHIESGNPPEVRAWPKSLWADETVTTRGKLKE